MTNLDDFDRSLGSFLADGPTIAPEAPVVAALAHARTTPRRRDPFAALRRDVMSRPFSLGGSRATLVFAALALVVASIGIAIVGSRPSDLTVPPGPTPSASPVPSGPGTGTYSATITLQVRGGRPIALAVRDTTGEVSAAVSGQPGDGASVEPGRARIEPAPGDPTSLIVTWAGLPCETSGAMLVDEGRRLITITPEPCSGDALAFDRAVILRFATAVDAGGWTSIVLTGLGPSEEPAPSSSAEPSAEAHVVLRSTGGNPASIDVVDLSGHLVAAEKLALAETDSVEFIAATNLDARTVKVAWPGSPCDTIHRLTIAADFGLTLDRPKCYGDSVPAFYAIQLTFDEPVDAGAMDVGLFDGRLGSGLPTMIVTGIDSAGSRYDLAVYDDSGRLVLPEPRSDGTSPPDPGAPGYVLDRISGADGRLTWRAPACATSQTLRIDATATNWQLGWQPCVPADPATLRVLDLQFDQLPDTTGITVTIGGPAS